MLDPRLYRAALIPVLVAVLLAAFSLENRPRPIGTTLAPDAFLGPRATTLLDSLADDFPDRRPGDAGDERLAARVADRLRSTLEAGTVTVERHGGDTPDGERALTTVFGTRPGRPGPGLVVVAHRDAQGRDARAELSGTAALLELARVTGEGRLNRTITFVSTSAGSAGGAGAAHAAKRLAEGLAGPVSAVLVLGDLAGERIRKPFVTGWSTGMGQAPLQLRRSVEAAVRAEAGTDPGGPRASTQWARLAFPVTSGEQGAFLDRGLPAVLLSVSGEEGPAADTPLAPGRLEVFGRAALRTITALDNGPDVTAEPEAFVVTQRKVLPPWAVRLLAGMLLLPPLLAAVDGFARLRRRREPVGRWVRWTVLTAVPFALTALVAVLLSATGLAGDAPPSPPSGGLDVDGTATGTLLALGIVLALAWLALRPMLLRAAGARGRGADSGSPGAGMGVLLVMCAAAVAVWAVNPHAALLLAPALHLWLLALSPETPLRGWMASGLVLVSAVPLLLVWIANASGLGIGPVQSLWLAVLLVGGGQVSAATWLLWSLVAACGACALMVAWHRPHDAPQAPEEVTVRGPVTYAGPGSLGGTESALRR